MVHYQVGIVCECLHVGLGSLWFQPYFCFVLSGGWVEDGNDPMAEYYQDAHSSNRWDSCSSHVYRLNVVHQQVTLQALNKLLFFGCFADVPYADFWEYRYSNSHPLARQDLQETFQEQSPQLAHQVLQTIVQQMTVLVEGSPLDHLGHRCLSVPGSAHRRAQQGMTETLAASSGPYQYHGLVQIQGLALLGVLAASR